MYPDNEHALNGVEAETTGFTALANWFLTLLLLLPIR
jgi:hypothetical protein